MPHTLGKIAEVIEAELHGDPGSTISGVAPLADAGNGHLSFLASPRYLKLLAKTRATAVIIRSGHLPHCPVSALVVADPYLAYVKAVHFLKPMPEFAPGVDARAVVSGSAEVASSAHVGPLAVIGERSVVGERAFVGPGCVIGDGVVVGADTRLSANVTLCDGVVIGARVLLHPGVVIGADGFGLASDNGKWVKIPQLGKVVLHDDVEVGANTAIDRGALEDTVIEEGVKIDNLVQIGHNTHIGAHTAVAGCAVIAGSVRIGKRCMIGGASAISGHIEIADDVTITGMSGVSNSIKKPGIYSGGIAATENRTWRRNMTRLKHLDELARRVRRIESAIEPDGPTPKDASD